MIPSSVIRSERLDQQISESCNVARCCKEVQTLTGTILSNANRPKSQDAAKIQSLCNIARYCNAASK